MASVNDFVIDVSEQDPFQTEPDDYILESGGEDGIPSRREQNAITLRKDVDGVMLKAAKAGTPATTPIIYNE